MDDDANEGDDNDNDDLQHSTAPVGKNKPKPGKKIRIVPGAKFQLCHTEASSTKPIDLLMTWDSKIMIFADL